MSESPQNKPNQWRKGGARKHLEPPVRIVSDRAKILREIREGGTSSVPLEELRKQFKPAPRRVSWLLGRLIFVHLVEGNLQRVADLCRQALTAYQQKDIDNSEPNEVYITQLDEVIGEKLFEQLAVETVWDLAQCRRSQVEQITQFGPERVKWCDRVLARYLYQWKPEEVVNAESAGSAEETVN
jgi:hypothetical protein